MRQVNLPRWLSRLAERLAQDTSLFDEGLPNHVLLNSYGAGEGILPHQDGDGMFQYHQTTCQIKFQTSYLTLIFISRLFVRTSRLHFVAQRARADGVLQQA